MVKLKLFVIYLLIQFNLNSQIKIIIQPYGSIDKETVDYLNVKLKNIFKFVQVNQQRQLPSWAYYAKRKRYRADDLLTDLNSLKYKAITVGITNKDISTTTNGFYDYGIFGLSELPGNVSIISTFRLKGNKENLYKLAIHEIGHALGLPHCKTKNCIMQDAEGKNTMSEEKDFCVKCKTYLNNIK